MNARHLVPVCALILAFATWSPSSACAGYPSAAVDFADESSGQTGSLDDYQHYGWDSETGILDVPIAGMTVREDYARLSSGQHVNGIGVIAVTDGGPAASAGLGGESKAAQAAVAVATVAAVVLFPPAAVGIAAVAKSGVVQSRDVIIAVDGDRTRGLMEFAEAVQKARAGEIIYLTIIRGGHRRDFRVRIPADAVLPSN